MTISQTRRWGIGKAPRRHTVYSQSILPSTNYDHIYSREKISAKLLTRYCSTSPVLQFHHELLHHFLIEFCLRMFVDIREKTHKELLHLMRDEGVCNGISLKTDLASDRLLHIDAM